MGRKSTIHKLPEAVRSHIERRLRENRLTLDELINDLQATFGASESLPARSTLGRYKKSFDEVVGRMREQQEMARMLVDELGENPDERAGQMLVQSITALTSHAAMLAQDERAPDIDTVRYLARAAKDILQARKISFDERLAIEKRGQEKLLAEQQENLKVVAREKGMDKDTVDFWRKRVLGVN
ncbi:small terminase subunit [Morganella morganii]|uniref:Small terminase subunit n=1 Tax=Morganella morganii TaxID=582 RepID=A0A8I0U333_MORMO|nr:phage protein Gp27 family protein [Morganella morganii]MBE8611515.1 small terminase subunit [Morganella morganii]